MVHENSDVPYYSSIKITRKIKQLLVVTFFYCEGNHNLSLNQVLSITESEPQRGPHDSEVDNSGPERK